MLEDELDDRVIEILKLKLFLRCHRQGRSISQVRYHDKDEDTLWFDLIDGEDRDIAGIPLDNYQSIVDRLPPLAAGFQEIDDTWALAYLKQERT